MNPTSGFSQSKPSLPPKPVKYRAPLPPSQAEFGREQPNRGSRVSTTIARCPPPAEYKRDAASPDNRQMSSPRFQSQGVVPHDDPHSKRRTASSVSGDQTELVDQTRPRSGAVPAVTSQSKSPLPTVTSQSKPPFPALTSESTSESESLDSLRDVIYDQPSSVEFEHKSLERFIMSDGYLKLRSDLDPKSTREARENMGGAKKKKPSGQIRSSSPEVPRKGLRSCRSSESVDRLDSLVDFTDCPNQFHAGGNGRTLRSSFLDPNGHVTRKSVYIELGEYQTLLKHSKNDEERVYSLPQPQCYGEDTLKAVKVITEKYDTFKRRQLRALSFRDGTGTLMKTPEDNEEDPKGVAAQEPSSPKERNNNKDNETKDEDRRKTDSSVESATTEKEVPEAGSKKHSSGLNARTRQFESLLLRDYCNTIGGYDDPPDGSGVGGVSGDVTLTKSNRLRIELFYRSRETSVYVCRCLADMFVGTCISEENCPMVHQHTGVPVWLLNSGAGIRSRELLLLLTERETGFPLWQDKINYLSNFREVSPGVQALRLSGSLRKMVRLHMFCQKAADEFLRTFHRITSDPQDDLWKISCEDSKRKSADANRKKRRSRRNRVSKSSISQPCNFVHISCVDPKDANFRAAFSGLIPMSAACGASSNKSPTADDCGKDAAVKDFSSDGGSPDDNRTNDSPVCEFRPRLPTR